MHSLNIEITPWNHLHLPQFLPKLHLLEESSLQVFCFEFCLFCVSLLLRDVGQNLCVRALHLLGKIFNLPKKQDKIQMRSELRQQLSSCLLDLVVVHIFFNLLEKYRVIFYWSSQKSMRDPCLPIVKVGVCIPPLPMDRGW